MTIQEIQNDIIADFSMFENWEQRYEYMIELGKNLPLISEEYKTPQYLIKGCQSQVWLFAEEKNGKVFYTADSDAIITKGIIAVLIRSFSGFKPKEILDADWQFFDKIGLREHLSPTRANGLASMVEQMKLYAQAYLLKK